MGNIIVKFFELESELLRNEKNTWNPHTLQFLEESRKSQKKLLEKFKPNLELRKIVINTEGNVAIIELSKMRYFLNTALYCIIFQDYIC